MVKIREASYIPGRNGGEIQATIEEGGQRLVSSWPIGDDEDLRTLVERLLVKVEQVTFHATDDGGEIRTTMNIGERDFVSRLHIEGQDRELRPLLDELLAGIGSRFVGKLEAVLSTDRTKQSPSERGPK